MAPAGGGLLPLTAGAPPVGDRRRSIGDPSLRRTHGWLQAASTFACVFRQIEDRAATGCPCACSATWPRFVSVRRGPALG